MKINPRAPAMSLDDDPRFHGISELTRLYGIHGTLKSASTGNLLEVRQLDFTLRDYVEDCTAVPEDRRAEYNRELVQSGLMATVVGLGAQYNVPVGALRWVQPDEPEHADLTSLPVIGLVP